MHNAIRQLLKTLGLIEIKQLLITATNATQTKERKKKSNEISQNDVLMEFGNENENSSDEDEDQDEVYNYAKVS